MNAKEYLSQAFYLEQQVQSKLEQLDQLNALATRVTAHLSEAPVSHSRNVSSMQDTVIRILEERENLNRKIDELVNKKIEITSLINQVQTVSYRLILEKRYICFFTWEHIAADLNCSRRQVQFKHKNALVVVQRLLDQRTPAA